MKKYNTEISEASKAKGYTMMSNISADCIKALKRWNKQDGKAIAQAIKDGDVKKAIIHMSNAKCRNQEIRRLSEHHDKIIYLNGEDWGYFEADTRKCYQFEK